MKVEFCMTRAARFLANFSMLIGSNILAEPLRVFIRAGVKTHGPNQHDHPRFLEDWKKLLSERGSMVDGSLDYPSAEQLDKTDVLIIYAQDGMNIVGAQRSEFEK